MSIDQSRHRQFFDMLMQSQWWPAENLEAYRRGHLTPLLRHARQHVPFYKDRLDVLFRPDGDIDWDRWGDVPIVKRADLAEHGRDLLATLIPSHHGGTTVSRTTGTSGKPIDVISTQLANVAIAANRYRAYRWHEVDWSRDIVSVFGDDPKIAAWPDGQRRGAWGPSWDIASADGTMFEINRATDNAKLADFMARMKPAYLSAGPKAGLATALEAERLGLDIRLDAFLPQGAMLGDLERQAMRRVFGARTIEIYSCKEGGQVAHQCPDHEGLHVNAESLLVEIVDDNGRPTAVGQQGRVILTTLLNSAQPLIRYDQGDSAAWMAPCPCGRCLPRMTSLLGRTTGMFYHPDGRVRADFLRAADRALLGTQEWQIAQTGPHLFEVRYVPQPGSVADETALAARFRAIYFDDAEVGFRRIETLMPGPTGKVVEYANEWLPPGRAG